MFSLLPLQLIKQQQTKRVVGTVPLRSAQATPRNAVKRGLLNSHQFTCTSTLGGDGLHATLIQIRNTTSGAPVAKNGMLMLVLRH